MTFLIFFNVHDYYLYQIPLHFGPSGVRALPLAAGRNEGGHYFRYFSFFLLLFGVPLFKTPEGVIVGFQNFWLLTNKNKNYGKK